MDSVKPCSQPEMYGFVQESRCENGSFKALSCLEVLVRWWLCRTPGIQVHLMGMATPHEVEADLQVVREALGLVQSPQQAAEEETLAKCQAVLKPYMSQTWHTGRHNNRT